MQGFPFDLRRSRHHDQQDWDGLDDTPEDESQNQDIDWNWLRISKKVAKFKRSWLRRFGR